MFKFFTAIIASTLFATVVHAASTVESKSETMSGIDAVVFMHGLDTTVSTPSEVLTSIDALIVMGVVK